MQQRDQYNTIEDFLADESFKAWVLTGEDADDWESWTVDNPQRSRFVQEARAWWLAMQVEETLPTPAETSVALRQTWDKIDRARQKIPQSVWPRGWWRVAAVLLVSVGLSTVWYFYNQTENAPVRTYAARLEQAVGQLIEVTNHTDSPQLVTLSDGSSVMLQPASRLSYPAHFKESERSVYLSGEGFFEISKNPQQPFLVYANELLTKVEGTSFRVRAYADQKDVEVVVRTGKVNVFSNGQAGETGEVLLFPNQGVRFIRERLAFEKIDDLTKEKPSSQTVSAIEKLSFEFSDAPVAQIFKTIEQAYLVEVDFPEEKLKDCYLTTSLSDEPLPQKLRIICSSLGRNASYQLEGNRIRIQAEGCY